jgi:predicted nucleotide-binding protein (sugar kinase/HSP70/actin superfamily)
MKLFQEEKIFESASKPFLTFLTDAQTNNAPFVTRMEAHERVVEKSDPGSVDTSCVSVLRRSKKEDLVEREWLIPFMGDDSYIGSAVLHHFGIDSRVITTNTAEGHELANKHIHTEVCYPLKGVVGDVLGFLTQEARNHSMEYVNHKYLVMLPAAGGPCRFGKYRELLRLFMDEEGFDKVPIEGPSSQEDYTDLPLPKGVNSISHKELMRLVYRGVYAADVLEDMTLRFRPYARVPEDVNELKQRKLEDLCACISHGGSLKSIHAWAEETVRAFKRIDCRDVDRYPLVLYMGEIYMRHHDPYTDFVINMLEDKGLEVIRSPVYEWLHYINEMQNLRQQRNTKISLRNFRIKDLFTSSLEWAWSKVRRRYFEYIEDRIEKPFYDIINGRHSASPSPREIISSLENGHHFHSSIEGESPLSIGLAYFFMKDRLTPHPENDSYISGIFHVGPFTCMQEGVATAKIDVMIKEYRKKKDDLLIPIVHAFFGDSPNPNLESEIAVFREQCYQKRDRLKEQHTREGSLY